MGDVTTPNNDVQEETIDYTNPPFPLTAIDRELLSMRDEDFHLTTWQDLREIITTNHLEQLKRLPTHLRAYLHWTHKTKQKYSNLTTFVISERLHWTPLTTSPPTFPHHHDVPFADPRDYAILLNDWPYGLARGITHLLVWSKTPIPVDAEKGDVTAESRAVIERFVERQFVAEVEEGWEQVQWFKNWVSLQSVRGVDHVHVLVRDVDEGVLGRWLRRRDLEEG